MGPQTGTWLSANHVRLEEFVDRELRFQVEAEQVRDGQITVKRSSMKSSSVRCPRRRQSALLLGKLVSPALLCRPSAG